MINETAIGKSSFLPGDFAFRGERLKRAQAPPIGRRVVDITSCDPRSKGHQSGDAVSLDPTSSWFKCEILLKPTVINVKPALINPKQLFSWGVTIQLSD